jgi:hypothetical protein
MSNNIPNMITGFLMSLFGYTFIFMLALAGRQYLPVYVYKSHLMNTGINFFLIDFFIGAVGGLLGGDVNERNGAIIGGVIAGILTGLVMVGFVISGY